MYNVPNGKKRLTEHGSTYRIAGNSVVPSIYSLRVAHGVQTRTEILHLMLAPLYFIPPASSTIFPQIFENAENDSIIYTSIRLELQGFDRPQGLVNTS